MKEVYEPVSEQSLLAEQILELVDIQQTPDGMSRGDLQGAIEALASKYQLREDV